MAASTPCPTNRALASILIFKRDPAERCIMPNTFFSSEGALLFIMVAMVALGFWLQRFKAFKTLGPALTVIIMGIVLSNLRIVPTSSATYDAVSSYSVKFLHRPPRFPRYCLSASTGALCPPCRPLSPPYAGASLLPTANPAGLLSRPAA